MRIRDFSIRFNLALLILTASVLAVLLASLGFAIYERQSDRASAVRELTALADTLGANTAASLAFNDERTAKEMLSALATEPNVLVACLYDNKGRIFAEYRSPGGPSALILPAGRHDGAYFDGESLTLFRGVLLNGERTGSIAIVFGFSNMRRSPCSFFLSLCLPLSWSLCTLHAQLEILWCNWPLSLATFRPTRTTPSAP